MKPEKPTGAARLSFQSMKPEKYVGGLERHVFSSRSGKTILPGSDTPIPRAAALPLLSAPASLFDDALKYFTDAALLF